MRRGSAASARRSCAWRRPSRIAACRSARSSTSAPAPAGCSTRSTVLLPEVIDRFHAVELYPPPLPHRTANPNYVIGTLADMQRTFDAGVCIEVIEHLTPAALRTLAAQLAAVSRPGSLYLFNSGQPDFVEHEDPGYLDPHRPRAHRVLFAGGRREHLRAGGLQRHRAARPRLGVPGRVRTAAPGRCRGADRAALASGAGECIDAAVGTVRRAASAAPASIRRAPICRRGRRRWWRRQRETGFGGNDDACTTIRVGDRPTRSAPATC